MISFYLNTYYTRKLLNYGFFTQLRELAPLIVLSFLVAALGWLCSWLFENAWLALGSALVACPLAYIGLCRLLHISAFDECCQLALKYLKK